MRATITAAELHDRIARGDRLVLLDVRSPEEWAICKIEGAVLMPLPTVPARFGELDRDAEIVCYCHVGARSAMAAAFLRRQGFPRVANLAGGIESWAATVDPAMQRY